MNLSDETFCNYSNATTTNGDHSKASAQVLFLCLSFAIGAAVRHLVKRTPLPYTVILITVGLVVGVAPRWDVLSFLLDYLTIAHIDPHLLLAIFLPTLIFESAFVMDVHTFKKTLAQASILAGPGLILSTVLLSLMSVYIFSYNWPWVIALLFGTILSATDPVSIVALLKELGVSKHLAAVIEGESLLNDGAAIVLFHVLIDGFILNNGTSAFQIFLYFLQVALGGPAFGYLMAKITIFWLSHVFNNALVEITITLASTYATYYIGEELLNVSGVLAIVTLGFQINSHKTSISPQVEVFLHRFWEVLGYFADTLIFIIVGIVISLRAFQDVNYMDWIYNIALYFAIVVIRLIVIGILNPILSRVGYSMNHKHVAIITWSGLKGAVSLALALTVAQTAAIDFNMVGSKILFHTAGIVVWTLLVNATSTKYLLRLLGLSEISMARRRTMALAVSRLSDMKKVAISVLKNDRFLADADWGIVNRSVVIIDPYRRREMAVGSNPTVDSSSLPTQQELVELTEEIRASIVRVEKTSYWRQFEQGMLSREAVRVLTNLADTVLDTPNRLASLKDIASHWRIPKIYVWIPQIVTLCIKNLKRVEVNYQPPTNKTLWLLYKLAMNPVFMCSVYIIVLLNISCSISQLAVTDDHVLYILENFNYCFCFIYLIEETIKMTSYRRQYWLDLWNWIDLIVLIIALADIVVFLTFRYTGYDNSIVIRALLFFRLTIAFRLLKVIKFSLPKLLQVMDYLINRQLRLGYDIGRGFVVGEDEVLSQFHRLKLVHRETAEIFKRKIEATRLDVIRSLGLIRKEYPGIALSVKTHHATRAVLNQCQELVKSIFNNGLIDDVDTELLLQIIDKQTLRLESTHASLLPTDAERLFSQIKWLNEVDHNVVSILRQHALTCQFDTGDFLVKIGDIPDGVYIIISGLVKVLGIPDNITVNDSFNYDTVRLHVIDFLGAGTLIGEMGLLRKNVRRNATVKCETDVQAFFISNDNLMKVMKDYPILEEKLWKICGVRIALSLLVNHSQYQDWSTSELLLMCENSYIVSNCEHSSKTFNITKDMKEVIIIEGELQCSGASKGRIVSPAVIPNYIKRLILTKETTKLLVIQTQLPADTSNRNETEVYDAISKNKLVQAYEKSVSLLQGGLKYLVGFWNRVVYQHQRTLPVTREHEDERMTEDTFSMRNIATDTSLRNISMRSTSIDISIGAVPSHVAMETIPEYVSTETVIKSERSGGKN